MLLKSNHKAGLETHRMILKVQMDLSPVPASIEDKAIELPIYLHIWSISVSTQFLD
jgi:hypothetical protein